jgi:hypothetical protein
LVVRRVLGHQFFCGVAFVVLLVVAALGFTMAAR